MSRKPSRRVTWMDVVRLIPAVIALIREILRVFTA
jgi:hypothetical protein